MAWPSIIESFFMSFTGMIDTMMVSTISAASVAAVGLTTQPKFIGLAPFIALTVATSAIIARRKGEQRREDANRSFLAILGAAILLTLAVSAACLVFASPVMELCGSAPDTHGDAVLYFRIIMGCIVFNTITMTINSAQRGSGNTKLAMRTNVTSSTVNIIFNYILINGHLGFPALGIKGAAIATVIGAAVGCVMSIISLFHKDSFVSIPYCIENSIHFSFKPLVPVVKLGSSVFLEQLLLRVGFMATAVMAAKLGTAPMAAHQVGMNILGLAFSFGDGFQAASVALIGQSLGRKEPEQADRYGKICQLFGMCVAILISILLFVGGRTFYGCFFEEEEIINIGVGISRMTMLIVLFQIPQVVFTGSLRGAGDVLFTTICSTISVTFVRTIVSYVACYVLGFGMIGIWCGILADQMCRFILSSLRYKSGKWMKIII